MVSPLNLEVLNTLLKNADLGQNVQRPLETLLLSIERAWLESEDDVRRLFNQRMGSSLASAPINLIPSQYSAQCQPVLVVLSIGQEFSTRLREAIDHCIRCDRKTRVVIVATDRWDDALFEREKRSTFETLYQTHGTRLAIFLKTGSRFTLIPVVA